MTELTRPGTLSGRLKRQASLGSCRGHTSKKPMRILRRHLSNVVYRLMLQDVNSRQPHTHR
jgi:hypothetical protein